MVLKLKIIKQVLQFEECLKQRLEFICEFSKVSPTFIKGSIRKIEKTKFIILYNRNEIYKKFDIMLKEVDEEYGTTLINFAKYKLVMFAMAKLMKMETTEQNKVALYLFNLI